MFLPWYNAYRFLVQNVLRLEVEGLAPFRPMDFSTLQKSTNALDRWINSASQSLVFFVRQEMEAYRLYTVSIIECKNQIILFLGGGYLLSCPGYCLIRLTSERLGTGGSFPA